MNLSKLFEMQKELDDYIVKTKGLEGQYKLPQKILALQVGLGECANEWRGFKFWSEKQKPNLEKIVHDGHGGIISYSNPLLEEYVDCLHFILSIGIEADFLDEINFDNLAVIKRDNLTQMFNSVFVQVSELVDVMDSWEYICLIEYFRGLGEMLGFTWDQISEAYTTKWNINKQRQVNGY